MSAAKSLNLLKSIEFLMRIESGPDAGKVYRIFPPKIEIGRDPSLQIVVTDPKASRHQCSIIIKDDVVLKDKSSKGTTFVNGNSFSEINLKPGDIISFGNTKIQFMAKSITKNTAAPKLSGAPANGIQNSEKQSSKKVFNIILGILVLLGASLFIIEDPVQKIEEQLVTRAELDQQIEDSKERQNEIKEVAKSKRKLKKRRYLFSVEKHFISGRRDLQTGHFGRAVDSFGTTMATDNNHSRAQQYSRIAKKKKTDLIDTHMRDGVQYKKKVMYDRCIAELEKAMVLINNKKTQKYRIAKTQLEECRVLKTGGF